LIIQETFCLYFLIIIDDSIIEIIAILNDLQHL